MIRKRDRKCKLYTQWEQLSRNQDVQRIKKEVNKKRKQKLQHSKGRCRYSSRSSSSKDLSWPSCTPAKQPSMDWG
jgi:hypothetical protein